MTAMRQGVFDGLKVIDCASFIAAPAAATVLSDFGADVIKVEPPGEGDSYRNLYKLPGMPVTELNYPWELASRNKRSLCLDLKTGDGHSVLSKLVAQADVFITNLPLPVRRRLKVTYEDLGKLNPRLIYGSFTAYGEVGEEAEKTGFDSTAYWARSGLMDLVRADHEAAPARSVPGMGDHPSAMGLYGGIVTALYRRERTGLGGLVSSSLLANGLWANGFFVQAALSGLTVPPRPKRDQGTNACTSNYRCADGRWFILTLLNEERDFLKLLDVIGRPDLAGDTRFTTRAARRANAPALIAEFDPAFASKPLAHWRAALDTAGITFGLIGTLDDIADDQQMRLAGALVPYAGETALTVSSPFQIDGETKALPRRAPGLGQHNDAILREVGYGEAEIQRLRELGVLA
jgi:crotonobetainyl-CoA:carnitine CoA-transferase CaiB-like acyl-CoA transferase